MIEKFHACCHGAAYYDSLSAAAADVNSAEQCGA